MSKAGVDYGFRCQQFVIFRTFTSTKPVLKLVLKFSSNIGHYFRIHFQDSERQGLVLSPRPVYPALHNATNCMTSDDHNGGAK
jgi:hypothetical protein